MKAIVASVRGAGIFKNPRTSYTKDKVYDLDGKQDRTKYIKVLGGRVSSGHIANLLRVLCGQRPVPQIRRVGFTGDPFYEEWAKEVRVSIQTPTNSKGFYPEELVTSIKSIRDSWQKTTHGYLLDNNVVSVKGGVLHWNRLRRHLGDSLYNDFVSVVSALCGGPAETQFTGQGAIEFLNSKKYDKIVIDLCIRLKTNSRTSLVNVILNTKPESVSFQSEPSRPLNLIMVGGSPEQLQRFDAKLFIPADECRLMLLAKGTGIATFMEGGVVSIEDVEDWSEEIINAQTEATVEGEYVSN